MKVCLISNLYKPFVRGGAEKIVEIIASELSKDNKVIVICPAPFFWLKEFLKIDEKENLKIYYIYNWNIYHLLNDYKHIWPIRFIWHVIDLFNFIVWYKVGSILKKEKPNLVWTHNLKGLSVSLPKIINRLGFKHLHQLHDLQLIDPAGTLYRSNKGNIDNLNPALKIYCYLTKKFSKQIFYIISPSNFTLAQHKKLGFFPLAKTLVLANPIDNPAGRWKPLRSSRNDKRIPSNNQSFNLLYLGQLEQQKGITFLIKTFIKLNNPKLRLVIAGRGSQEHKVIELIKNDNRIKFLGYLNKDHVSLTFQQVDLTVVPSLCYENSPQVIYESYANGVPVLVSDAGGSQELVEQGITGEIFKTNNKEDLLNKINNFMENINSWRGQSEYLKQKTAALATDLYVKKIFDFIKHDN